MLRVCYRHFGKWYTRGVNRDLIKQNEQLQKEGEEVLASLQLLRLLKEIGEVHLVGSFPLGLMVWRDIDIEVMAATAVGAPVAVITKLLSLQYRRFDFTVLDNRNLKPGLPNGVYLGIKYYGYAETVEQYRSAKEKVWKIDIWFLASGDIRSGKDQLAWLKKSLTPEKREQILEIKAKVYTNPAYRHAYHSVDIYKAVLEEGVTDVDGFRQYLAKTGREL